MPNDASTMSLETLTEWAEEDRALVSAAQSDTAAAGQLFDKYYPEIFRYVHHSTLDHAVTEDLTSNVFFSAFRHLGLFRWRRIPFRAWLYRIATNEFRMHYSLLCGVCCVFVPVVCLWMCLFLFATFQGVRLASQK